MKNKFLFYLIYGLFLITLLAIMELSIRVLANQNPTIKLMVRSPYRAKDFDKIHDLESLHRSTDCSLQPGQLFAESKVNSRGFLGPELPYKKSPGEYRIIFLGDSQVVGVIPYKLHFVQLIEDKLNQDKRFKEFKRFQSINLGMVCTATSIYLKQLEVEGFKYKPDLILLGFFVGNDFTEDYTNSVLADKLPSNNNKFSQLFFESRILSLIVNSFKTRFFTSYKNSQYSKSLGKIFEERHKDYNYSSSYDPFETRLPKDKFMEVETNRLTILNHASKDYVNLKLVEKNLQEIKKLSDQISAKLVVFIIPDEFQINSRLMQELILKNNIETKDLDINKPQNTIIKILKNNKINYIDLMPDFLKDPKHETFYQPQDTHLNSIGTKKTAEILTEHIKKIISLANLQ